jgi:MoaA/NifB/PqqE/SkfB family radical SAM enzyme
MIDQKRLIDDVIKEINSICFELSSLCNYSLMHRKCPVSCRTDHAIMPASIVFGVIDELSKWNYSGILYFNIYNEPLIDPRLFVFTKYAKKRCPQAKIGFTTNGFYLDKNLAQELSDFGIDGVVISLYTKKEKERLSAINFSIPVELRDYTVQEQDERLKIYDGRGRGPVRCSARQPLGDIQISFDGKIILCCLDWEKRYVFGDLRKQSLEEIITSDNFLNTADSTCRGNQKMVLCKKCSGWSSIVLPSSSKPVINLTDGSVQRESTILKKIDSKPIGLKQRLKNFITKVWRHTKEE